MSKLLPFKYFGSKVNSFNFINSNLPRTRQYVEPFGGAGTILLNRDPVPSETYNDLYGDIPHFFRVLREDADQLIEALRATPYSREEYEYAVEQRNRGYPDAGDVERARLFFIVMQQSRGQRQHEEDPNWSYIKAGARGRGADQTTSPWKSYVEGLEMVAGRLRDCQVESEDAIDVIRRYDTEVATIYVDPPYVADSRGSDDNYGIEMTEEDHRDLALVLSECDGYVALSGYANDLYDTDLYDDWYRYTSHEKGTGVGNGTRQEVLWTNYDADELGGQKIGDWPEPGRKGKQLTLTGSVE